MDSWCRSINYRGKKLSGGAARNVRIKASGGMDNIISKVATLMLENADELVLKETRPNLKLVVNN